MSRPANTAPETREVTVFQDDLQDVGVSISGEDAKELLFLAERKYNRYDLYAPGETFQQRLVDWLSNFEVRDRHTAMAIVRELRFVSQPEARALAAATLQNIIDQVRTATPGAARASPAAFLESVDEITEREISRSLFVAMADDVLFDFFRRNAQRMFPGLERGNFVEYYKLDPDIVKDLAEHSRIFLLDQISGSSLSFLRFHEGRWKGKLPSFCEIWKKDLEKRTVGVVYCPYVMSTVAEKTLTSNFNVWPLPDVLATLPSVLPTQMIPVANCLSVDGQSVSESTPVAKLCEKYYDRFREDEHTQIGGGCKFGFGKAGLLLVEYTNCPNDTIYLIWHDNNWSPLFPRVSHHR